MGCFFACFSTSKHEKHRHLVNATPSKDLRDGASGALQFDEFTKQEIIEEPIKLIAESKHKLEEKLSCNGKKKVTFDLNVKTYEALSTEEATNNNVVENGKEKESENKEEPSNETKSISNLVTPNVAFYPSSHRYQNCVTEEDEDLVLEDSDLDAVSDGDDDDNVGGQVLVQEESSESLFSLSIDSRKQACGAELGEKEVTSPTPKCGSPNEELKADGSDQNVRNRSLHVDSVLNPVENLTQWKAVKERATLPFQHQDKENVNVGRAFDLHICPEPSFELLSNNSKANANQKKLGKQEIAVDTSLSNWLVESNTTPMYKSSTDSVDNLPSGRASSQRSDEDRPIFGAWTVEELKQLSAFTSPRWLRSWSPDETPIIGTVGSYWHHTGRTMDSDSGSSREVRSKNGEDETVKWNSTPLEARLERALDRGVTQVHLSQ